MYRSRKEIELRTAFKYFDFDQSGSIEIAELKEIFKKPWIGPPPEDSEKFFARLDVNSDGKLTFDEFLDGWRNTFGPAGEDMLFKTIAAMAKDKTLERPESSMGSGPGVVGSRPQTRSGSPKKKKGGDIPDDDKAQMQKLVDDAVAACPEGFSRQVGVSVTIKGGMKLTTLEIHDTNLKNGKVSTKYQKFGNKAGMKGSHSKRF